MDDMESKLGAILSNPDMMAQIMTMAQQLGGGTPPPSSSPPTPPPPPPQSAPPPPQSSPQTSIVPEGVDVGMLAKLAGMANSSSVDPNQRALLTALRPYLAGDRIIKLEKAMRAAKLATIASAFLGSGILSKSGR